MFFFRLSVNIFRKRIELVNSFITFLLNKQRNTSPRIPPDYESDWRISSAARVMALLCTKFYNLFEINNSSYLYLF